MITLQFFRCKILNIDSIRYCTDIDGLMSSLGVEHNVEEWRLFIDSSKTRLKAVLLHNGNK